MAEFLKKLRRSANPCKEVLLPEKGYYKGVPLGEVIIDEASSAKTMKVMAKLAESIHSSPYEKVDLRGWFAESEHKYDAANFFEKPKAKPKAKPKSTQADIPLTQTDMVW